MEGFNYIDFIILAGLLGGFIGGIRSGLLLEVAGVIGLLAGILGARFLGPIFLPTVRSFLNSDSGWTLPLSYFAVFLLITVAIRMLAWGMTKTVELIALGGINKLLGGIFAGLKYILLFSILFNVVSVIGNKIAVPGEEARKESKLYTPIESIVPAIFPYIKELYSNPEILKKEDKTNIITV
ncbi:MAG: CvpA family protein [Bacteroidales bacterium]